ncbi:hypothetical protein ES708_25322 [subsurface metagenome]
MKAFVGYARRQAAKYGIKGSRLDAAKSVLDYINYYEMKDVLRSWKLKDVWDKLPTGEHIHKDKVDPNGLRVYEVCGKKVQETASLEYLHSVISKFYTSYGERARMAQANEGIDFKAVSHAIRAAYQTKEILINNTITYPLKEAKYLKLVKAGKLDYTTEVAPLLESLMLEVEMLSALKKKEQSMIESVIQKIEKKRTKQLNDMVKHLLRK